MMNDSTLKAGQVVKFGGALYRVDIVNACRARVVPLSKHRATIDDGRELDGESRGISISATACVEIVTDLDRARTEVELLHAERELAAAKNELVAQDLLADELFAAEAELAALRASIK